MHLDQGFRRLLPGSGGITVQNAATYTIDSSTPGTARPATTYSVAQGGVLNIGKTDFTGPITLAGTGTINVGQLVNYSSDLAPTFNFSAAMTLIVANAAAVWRRIYRRRNRCCGHVEHERSGEWAIQAANYSFGGQLACWEPATIVILSSSMRMARRPVA